MYSDEQTRYDAFHNEWDLCDEFGPGGGDSSSESDGEDTFQDLEGHVSTKDSILGTI